MNDNTCDQAKLIPPSEALRRLGGFSKAKLYRLMGTPGFPQRVYIGRSIYFVEAEIDAYIKARLDERNKPARGSRKAA